MHFGIPLTVNTDAHSPSDLITKDLARTVLLAAGIEQSHHQLVFQHAQQLVEKALRG
jgi:histidinol phosphatase-like PHP family hydrolase